MGHPHRLDSSACTGTYRYFLTICSHERRRYFADSANVALVRSQIICAANAATFAIPAYCFMPDHLHAVVKGQDEQAELAPFVRLAKQISAYAFRRATGARLWQRSYFDRTLRVDEAVDDVIRYVIENPIRAGLVQDPSDYPHWGSSVYSRSDLLDLLRTKC